MNFNIIAYSFISENMKLFGGAEIYLYDLSKLLLKEGHEVTVIQSWYKDENFEFENIKIKGLKRSKLAEKMKIFGGYHFNRQWNKALDKDVDKIHLHDIFHAYPHASNRMTGTSHGITWDCPKVLVKKEKKKHLLRRVYWDIYQPTKATILDKRYRAYINHSIKTLRKIASVDTFLLRYVQSQFPDFRDKIEVIPNYVKTDIFNPNVDGKEIRKKFEDKIIVLFPRNLRFVRGIHLAVEAVKRLSKEYPEILLLMVGSGDGKKWIEEKIKEYSLNNNIVLEGAKEHMEMAKYFVASDIIIIPSICSEGAALSCLEAMVCKKPVVVTNIGGLPDLVIDRFNGLICKPEPTSLAEKIKLLIENNNLRQKISSNALHWVKERHNYELWCKRYKEFFEV